jgi:hypothetical protein
MKTTNNLMLVLLVVTAAILGAILVGSYTAQVANADISIKQGDYLIGSMTIASSRDLIYVIDISARKMNVYTVINSQSNRIDGIDMGIDLDRAFSD